MCSNYEPVTRADRLLSFFGVVRGRDEPPTVVFPTGLAPFIRLAEDGSGNRRVDDGIFGLLPHFRRELAYGRKTYNARSETVHSLASYRDAWKRGQRCVIPAEAFFEPKYDDEGKKSVRWRIQQPGEVPMGIAGVYMKWHSPDGVELFSFAMLTVNADGHPVMAQFHRPQDEKRMVVILDPEQHDRWLNCSPAEAAHYFRQWMGPLETHPAPLPPRAPRSYSGKVSAQPAEKPDQPSLF